MEYGVKSTFSILTLFASILFWVIFLPTQIFDRVPLGWRAYLDQGGTFALLISFLLVPVALGIMGLLALVCWMLVSSRFLVRAELEDLMSKNIFGTDLGGSAKRALDWIYSR